MASRCLRKSLDPSPRREIRSHLLAATTTGWWCSSGVGRDAAVEARHVGRGVEDEHRDVRATHRPLGAALGVELDGVVDDPLLADAGGVDQDHRPCRPARSARPRRRASCRAPRSRSCARSSSRALTSDDLPAFMRPTTASRSSGRARRRGVICPRGAARRAAPRGRRARDAPCAEMAAACRSRASRTRRRPTPPRRSRPCSRAGGRAPSAARRRFATRRSRAVTPSRASTTKRMTSASPTAVSTCALDVRLEALPVDDADAARVDDLDRSVGQGAEHRDAVARHARRLLDDGDPAAAPARSGASTCRRSAGRRSR